MVDVRKWSGDLHKLIYTHVLLIGVPTIFITACDWGINLINVHMAIATFFY